MALIQHQAFFDALTGHPNRTRLIRDLRQAVSPALFLIDIDEFKEINDIFGPRVGDAILIALGRNIAQHLPKHGASLYKLAADEYAVLFSREGGQLLSPGDLSMRAQLISSAVAAEKFNHHEFDLRLRVTIGIADSSIVGVESLLVSADMALVTAKRTHKPYLLFKRSADTRERFSNNIHWLSALNEALEQDRIIPYFQPIVENATLQVNKYECLMRLIDKDGQAVAPGNFLSIAKKARLYPTVSRTMLKKSLQHFANSPFEFSLNICLDDIVDSSTSALILSCFMENSALRNRAVFEILESEGIENYDEVSRFIDTVKGFGCKIALDDFGSGYSNYEYIAKLNIDYLKIDGSLIKNLNTSPHARIIVANIASFTHELNIKTIAEFVHCRDIFEIVQQLGVDFSQGFFLGVPRPDLDPKPDYE